MHHPGPEVAQFAHLGGMLVRFTLLKLGFPKIRWTEGLQQLNQRRRFRLVHDRQKNRNEVEHSVDSVLDRPNEIGFNNLSEKENFKKCQQVAESR